MKIEIVGAPFNALKTDEGYENPAEALREAGLVSLLKDKGHEVTDSGDLTGFQFGDIPDPETGINDFAQWLDLSNELSRSVGDIIERRSFPLVLGGDCRMLVGIFKALVEKRPDTGLIFADGHADFHTAETSPTGDPADMELAVLTGRGPDSITRLAGRYPMIKEADVVVFGIRDWEHIAESNIRVFDYQRMMEIGIESSVNEGLRTFSQRKLPAWLHFDVDVLDPGVMPVMYPEPGGMTFEQAREFLNLVWASSKVVGLSVACFHPSLDKNGSAAGRLVTLISDLLSLTAKN